MLLFEAVGLAPEWITHRCANTSNNNNNGSDIIPHVRLQTQTLVCTHSRMFLAYGFFLKKNKINKIIAPGGPLKRSLKPIEFYGNQIKSHYLICNINIKSVLNK